jgi:hypothetical protein
MDDDDANGTRTAAGRLGSAPSRPRPLLEFRLNTAAVPAVLLHPLARLGAASAEVTGPPGVRERLRLAEAGRLGELEAAALGEELDRLAVLLAGR